MTPLEAFALGEVAEAAELPPGVLDVVTGDIAASEHLTTHPGVDMVSFTGSDAVGKQIMSQAAEGLKKVLLELGGKSPNIVFGSDRQVRGVGRNRIHDSRGSGLRVADADLGRALDLRRARRTNGRNSREDQGR